MQNEKLNVQKKQFFLNQYCALEHIGEALLWSEHLHLEMIACTSINVKSQFEYIKMSDLWTSIYIKLYNQLETQICFVLIGKIFKLIAQCFCYKML